MVPALFPLLAQTDPARPLGAAGPDLSRYVLVCALLVLLCGGLTLAFRKGLAVTLRRRAAQRSLSVLDVLPLGRHQRLAVVRCYDRTFVLGLGDKEVAPIAELDPAIGAGAREPAAAAGVADRDAFLRALEKVRESLPAPRLGARTSAVTPAPTSAARPAAKRSRRAAAPEPAAPASASGAGAGAAREAARPRLEGIVG